MKTSPTTFEQRIRAALLDVVYAQWREFGLPFNPSLPPNGLEVIDPEALIWCSLEFLPSEPRLAEGVHAWIEANRARIIRQRLNRSAAEPDVRSEMWHAIDSRRRRSTGRGIELKELRPIGKQSTNAATLLLRARDLLGNDGRSFLIVSLIGSPRGIRLRDVSNWTGYSYRSLAEAAAAWERAGVVRVQSGHCILLHPAPWHQLLGCEANEVVTVAWHAVYGATIKLLRTLLKAQEHDFPADHPLVKSEIDAARMLLGAATVAAGNTQTPALAHLQEALVVK